MKNNDAFEKEVVDKLIKSLVNDSDVWELSIMGIRRKSDGLDLNISAFDKVSIHHPREYEFENIKIMKILFKEVKNVQNKLIKKRAIQNKKNNIKELTELLDLNVRKIKLDALKNDSDDDIVKKKRIWDIFRLKK